MSSQVVVPEGLNVPLHAIRRKAAKVLHATRCKPEDACLTQGDKDNCSTICKWFARGCCRQGKACRSLHRIPTEADEQVLIQHPGLDIFGRQHSAPVKRSAWTLAAAVEHRTLYVNYEGAGSLSLPHIRQLLESNFSPWGTVESLAIKHNLTIAFVTGLIISVSRDFQDASRSRYTMRCSAEFAKEAMDGQRLLGSTQSEVLMVRWSRAGGGDSLTTTRAETPDSDDELASTTGWEHMTPEERAEHIRSLNMASAIKSRRIGEYPSTDAQYRQLLVAHPGDPAQHPGTTSGAADGKDDTQEGATPSGDKTLSQDGDAAAEQGAGARTEAVPGPESAVGGVTEAGAATGYGHMGGGYCGTGSGYGAARTGYGAATGYGAKSGCGAAPTGYGAPRTLHAVPAGVQATLTGQTATTPVQGGTAEDAAEVSPAGGVRAGSLNADSQGAGDDTARYAAWQQYYESLGMQADAVGQWQAYYAGVQWHEWYNAQQTQDHVAGTQQTIDNSAGHAGNSTATVEGVSAEQGSKDAGDAPQALLELVAGYESDG